jgi:Aspartyl/Asparaginyl beta-hydroxylase
MDRCIKTLYAHGKTVKFIEKINFTADVNQMINDLNLFISRNPWPNTTFMHNNQKYHANQLGLTYRPNADYPLGDAGGSLYDPATNSFTSSETDFTEWTDVEPYTKNIIEQFSTFVDSKFGRIRYMRLMPKTGLSVHADFECRYHYVLETNKYAYFGEAVSDNDLSAKCYNIPADGSFYRVDTTREHFVYNGGWEPRIHLVICSA